MKKRTIFVSAIALSMAASILAGCKSGPKGFTITWVDYDQTVLEVDKNVSEGEIPTYDGPVPERASTEVMTYVFTGFAPKVQPAFEDATYVAQYNEIKKAFTVTWLNYDGSVLEVDNNVPRNATPSYDGATPIKPKSAQYSFSFVGWDKELLPVTEDVTFTALFSHTTNTYNVTWKNGETTLKVDELQYGTTPVYEGEEPEKASTDTLSFVFSGWSPDIVPVSEDATYYAQFESTPRKYSVKFYDKNDQLISKGQYDYGATVDAPSGTFRTFYNILGYNAKVGGVWDDTLLTTIPTVSADVDYRVVLELKSDKDYLLTDLSGENDVSGSNWDYEVGGTMFKQEIDDIPSGITMSNRDKAVVVSTKNGIATLKVGADFLYTVRSGDFDDTDYVQVYANFPAYAGGSKYNDIAILLCKGQSFNGGGQYYGFDRNASTDNSGNSVYYNDSSYWLKQVSSNGGWQQLKIYVSELKTMLDGVPETNRTEFDSISLTGIRDASSPMVSSCAREVTLYDVEFHRIDISQNFIINDCTNMAQIRNCTNTYFNASNFNAVELYDTTVPYNNSGTDYPIGKPTTSLKTGNIALNSVSGGWESQCGLDISLLVNNIDLFDDNDEIVTYIWAYHNYGVWGGKGSVNELYFNGNNVNMTNSTEYAKNCGGSGKHGEDIGNEAWMEARITIAEFKALTAMGLAYNSSNYTHAEVNKTNWLAFHIKSGPALTPDVIYSVELHHAQ